MSELQEDGSDYELMPGGAVKWIYCRGGPDNTVAEQAVAEGYEMTNCSGVNGNCVDYEEKIKAANRCDASLPWPQGLLLCDRCGASTRSCALVSDAWTRRSAFCTHLLAVDGSVCVHGHLSRRWFWLVVLWCGSTKGQFATVESGRERLQRNL